MISVLYRSESKNSFDPAARDPISHARKRGKGKQKEEGSSRIGKV